MSNGEIVIKFAIENGNPKHDTTSIITVISNSQGSAESRQGSMVISTPTSLVIMPHLMQLAKKTKLCGDPRLLPLGVCGLVQMAKHVKGESIIFVNIVAVGFRRGVL